MILVTTRMRVLSEKRIELSQAIASLSTSIRKEKGCRRCDLYQSIEDEDRLFLLEEWETQNKLASYLISENYKIFLGAMNLLQEPYVRISHNVSPRIGD